MPRYRLEAGASRVVTTARSSVHDTRTVWDKVTGTVDADPDAIEDATAEMSVDMTAFDAGDFLKNRKLKKDLDTAAHPTASFRLTGIDNVTRNDDGTFAATANGVIAWRGREARVTATGSGSLSDSELNATASFELDVTDLGVKPPRFLMFKVEKVVAVDVTLRGRAE